MGGMIKRKISTILPDTLQLSHWFKPWSLSEIINCFYTNHYFLDVIQGQRLYIGGILMCIFLIHVL